MINYCDCLRQIIHDSSLSEHIALLLGSCFFFVCIFFSIRITRKFYRKATPGTKKINPESRSPLYYPCIIFIAIQFLIWNLRIESHVGMEETARTVFLGMIMFFITGFFFDIFKMKSWIKYLIFPTAAIAYSFIFSMKTSIVSLPVFANHVIWILWAIISIYSFVLTRHYTFMYSVCGFFSTSAFFLIAICSGNTLVSLLYSIWAGIFIGIGIIAKYRENKYKGLAVCAVASMGFMMACLSVLISYAANGYPIWNMGTPVILIMPFVSNAVMSLYDRFKGNKMEEKIAVNLPQALILIVLYLINTTLGLSLRFTENWTQASLTIAGSMILTFAAAYLHNDFKKPTNLRQSV